MTPLAAKYAERARRVGPVTQRARQQTAQLLETGYHEAVGEELYQRTPLPVTHRMEQSIVVRVTGTDTIEAGFRLAIAPYAGIRVAMHGTSKTGGHQLDMNPAEFVRLRHGPQLRALWSGAQREILR